MVACNGWSIAPMVLASQVHMSTHASQRSSIVSVHTTALVLLARHPVRTHGSRGTAAEVPCPEEEQQKCRVRKQHEHDRACVSLGVVDGQH